MLANVCACMCLCRNNIVCFNLYASIINRGPFVHLILILRFMKKKESGERTWRHV